jgi:hypothetical protein
MEDIELDSGIVLESSIILEIKQLGISDIMPTEILDKLVDLGIQDKDIRDIVVYYSHLESPDGGAKLLRHYRNLEGIGYSKESLNIRIVDGVKHRLERAERNREYKERNRHKDH